MTLRESKEERFQRLFKRFYRPIAGYLVRLGVAREQARDLAQDVFLRVYRSMDVYRGEAEWTFLEVTARRVALNHFRGEQTQKRRGILVPIDALNDVAAEDPPDLAEEQEREAQREKLHAAIATLPDPIRKCVSLRLAGSSYNEIQAICGVSLDTVKSRLHEARLRLKKELGITLPER
jgi:RNA polymerase sigma-70 factor (ECF subfamily)